MHATSSLTIMDTSSMLCRIKYAAVATFACTYRMRSSGAFLHCA